MMQHYKHRAAELILLALNELGAPTPFDEILNSLETPPKKDMGDLAFPCFRLAKQLKKAPPMISQDMAEIISKKLSQDSDDFPFQEGKPIGPYFNLFFNPKPVIEQNFTRALESANQNLPFGKADYGENKKVLIEYSSPNIGKPMHIGHLRVTIVGACLNRIYRHMGFDVTSINHLGDWGSQFGKLALAFDLWGDQSELESDPFKHLTDIYVKFHKEAEEDSQLEDKARATFKKLEDGDEKVKSIWKTITDLSLKKYSEIYKELDAEFDEFLGESFYEDKMAPIIEELKEKKLLIESDGAQIVDLEKYKMPPMIVVKSDGTTIYATRDLAAADYRAKTWPFEKLIYVVGAQQELHFRQLFQVLDLMGRDWAKDCHHVKTGWYQFQGTSLSTRKGQTLLLDDVFKQAKEKVAKVINEKNPNLPNKEEVSNQVAIGATVFADLFTDPGRDVNFDFDRVLDFQGETGPYLQYTYARSSSILRKVKESVPNAKAVVDFDQINDADCLELAKLISQFEIILMDVIRENKPSLFSHYLISLAGAFNRFYLNHRVLSSDTHEVEEATQNANLAVVTATRHVLKQGLKLLGVPAPEAM